MEAQFSPRCSDVTSVTRMEPCCLRCPCRQGENEAEEGLCMLPASMPPRSPCVPAPPVMYPNNQGLNSLLVWVGATASKVMRFCVYLCQLFTKSSNSFFNYSHFHHLSASLGKFDLAGLPVGQKFSYRFLTLDGWVCKMAEVIMNLLAFTFLFLFFLHFCLYLNLSFLLAAFCLPGLFILLVLQKSSPIKFQATQSEFSYQALQDRWNPLLFLWHRWLKYLY